MLDAQFRADAWQSGMPEVARWTWRAVCGLPACGVEVARLVEASLAPDPLGGSGGAEIFDVPAAVALCASAPDRLSWHVFLAAGYHLGPNAYWQLTRDARSDPRYRPRRPKLSAFPSSVSAQRDAAGRLIIRDPETGRVMHLWEPQPARRGKTPSQDIYIGTFHAGDEVKIACRIHGHVSTVSIEMLEKGVRAVA